jgi:hypothetical protein
MLKQRSKQFITKKYKFEDIEYKITVLWSSMLPFLHLSNVL